MIIKECPKCPVVISVEDEHIENEKIVSFEEKCENCKEKEGSIK
jgi:hypothetical protein